MDLLSKKIDDTKAAVTQAQQLLERHDAAMRAAAEKYSETERYLASLKIELQALEEADRLRPENQIEGSVEATADGPSKRGGRQPGSIGTKWRMALSDIVAAGNRPIELEQFYLMTRARLGLSEASVRERVRQYANQGILIETGGKFMVSDYSINKFNLMTSPTGSDLSDGKNATAPH